MKIKDFELVWEGKAANYFEDGIRCENCRELKIEGYSGKQPHGYGRGAALNLINCEDVSVLNCRASESTGVFLAGSGITGTHLFLGNDLSKVGSACSGGMPALSGVLNVLHNTDIKG